MTHADPSMHPSSNQAALAPQLCFPGNGGWVSLGGPPAWKARLMLCVAGEYK